MVKSKVTQAALGVEKGSDKPAGSGIVLVVAALDMSWRLAIVVLAPIIGGFELDKHLGTGPGLTIAGFLVAMVGMFWVLKRTVAAADDKFKPKGRS